MRFSERMGLSPLKNAIQLDSMDGDLRAGLWNVFRPVFLDSLNSGDYRAHARSRLGVIWDQFFKLPTDEAPTDTRYAVKLLKPEFLSGDYLRVYDLIDFTVQRFGDTFRTLASAYNVVLEREVAGYRFVGGVLSPISSEYELQSIEEGLAAAVRFSGAALHLQTALKYLSDRESPDYRNSIKESISAVESVAQELTGKPKATLGDLLPMLEKAGTLHRAQREAFSKLYGYTSDEGGIRHALLDDDKSDFAAAKYMLAVCSAFIVFVSARA